MEEFTRDDLLALLDDLGGADKASLQDADDNYLAAIVKNRILLVADIARIDKALAKIMPMEWRAELMMHRNTLERAAQAVREAASGRQPPCGNLVVNIPEGVGLSHFHGKNGRVVCARRATADGRIVMDLFADEFRTLLSNRQNGLAWHNANPEGLRQLAEVA